MGPEVEFGGRLFYPAKLDRSIQQVVTLPDRSIHFESTTKLFTTVQQLFVSLGFPGEIAVAATYFAFATWFAEVLPIAPCLLITGPALEAAYLLDTLACVVRRPLPISDFTPQALYSLPMQLQPALLINTEHPTSVSLKLLRISNSQRAFFFSKGSLVNGYCAKAAYCGHISDTLAIDERALHIGLQPFGELLPILDRKSSKEMARELQANS